MLNGLRSFDGDVVLRFAHEMNGNWYPWSLGSNSGPDDSRAVASQTEWQSVWRYLVRKERGMDPPSNIRWFWCANSRDVGGFAMEEYWPGCDWVDICGVDAYNEPGQWSTFGRIVAGPRTRVRLFSEGKPFWVGETGTNFRSPDGQFSRAQWLSGIATAQKMLGIDVVMYSDFGSGERAWKLAKLPVELQALRDLAR